MSASVGTQRREQNVGSRPGPRWQDVVLSAQLDLADALVPAIGEGRLNPHSYRDWLATESALCQLNALAMDELSRWHGAQPTLRSAALGWAMDLRADALAADADMQRIGGRPTPLPTQLGAWQSFLQSTCVSARAGEALGVVVLHARLMRGPMREPIAAIAELPFVVGGSCSYLLQRRQPDIDPEHQGREALIDAYAAAALAAGAKRAADWYRAAWGSVLAPEPTIDTHPAASVSGMRKPEMQETT